MLSTARAIVVDDSYSQVEPAIRALSRLGIGAAYFSGRIEDVPSTPLHGIRLAVVDMDLGNGTPDQSAADTARQTLGYLASLLASDSNPLMVVVWTGSEEVYQEFRIQLSVALPNVTPAVVCRLNKADFVLTGEDGVEAAVKAFSELIQDELEKVRPLDVLWAWEQAVHDAASRTTSALADVIRTPDMKPGHWPAAASDVLAALARAAAGRHRDDAQSLLNDLLGSFEPLLQDRIEHHRIKDYAALEASAETLRARVEAQAEQQVAQAKYRSAKADQDAFKRACAEVDWDAVNMVANHAGSGREANAGRRRSKVEALVRTPVKPPAAAVTGGQAARLNGMLQWSTLPGEQPGVRPGNIYLLGNAGSDCHTAVTAAGLNPDDLKKNTLRRSNTPGDAVLVEATPACDYAQGKWMMPRFVLGYLVTPEVAAKLPAGADYLRVYTPAWQEIAGRAAGPASLVLNAHFTISLSMTQAKALTPVLRLRRSVLTDLQVWLAAQHMRQGLLSVAP